MSNPAPITLQQLFRYVRKNPDGSYLLPHQAAAVSELEADIRANGYAPAMRRDRPWFATWSQAGKQPDPPALSYLRLTRTREQDGRGLELLRLQFYIGNQSQGDLLVVSGAPGAQRFRTGVDSKAGSLEPLPEGQYRVQDIAWAGGRDNWEASWGIALGPCSVPLTYQAPGWTERSAIEIHIDWNGRTSPGTAGCVGVRNVADMKRLVGWLRQTDPRRLYVDWGLGTCPPIR